MATLSYYWRNVSHSCIHPSKNSETLDTLSFGKGQNKLEIFTLEKRLKGVILVTWSAPPSVNTKNTSDRSLFNHKRQTKVKEAKDIYVNYIKELQQQKINSEDKKICGAT